MTTEDKNVEMTGGYGRMLLGLLKEHQICC
jgi:hypothetical protein